MATEPLNLKNIQGDILGGLPKKTQTNVFFQIIDVTQFRKQLRTLIPMITTTEKVMKDRDAIDKHKKEGGPGLLRLWGVNIAFSHVGFKKLNIDDAKLTDTAYLGGQRSDAQNLGDPGSGDGPTFEPNWLPEFKKDLHGVIVFTGDRHHTVEEKKKIVLGIFGVPGPKATILVITSITGDVRPGKESGHEHFGFMDGISNPAVIGFDKNPPPGPAPIRPGFILLGREGDTIARDPWMVDGSFLTFRYLFQLVPEFNNFLTANPVQMPGFSAKEGSELLGARFVGRWKSGAPIDLRPFEDDPVLAKDKQKNNNFFYTGELTSQKICPFAAHTRKTNPRADLGNKVESHRILRRGIQFGPELTNAERNQNKTIEARGLIFHSYQTSILAGFRFLQISWADNPNFPFTETTPEKPGFDAIIGQKSPLTSLGQERHLSGTNPDDPKINENQQLPPWVIPQGGEYFFSPSIKGLTDTISLP